MGPSTTIVPNEGAMSQEVEDCEAFLDFVSYVPAYDNTYQV
jgi:hypothetical protein